MWLAVALTALAAAGLYAAAARATAPRAERLVLSSQRA
jgi:hypothetical protein